KQLRHTSTSSSLTRSHQCNRSKTSVGYSSENGSRETSKERRVTICLDRRIEVTIHEAFEDVYSEMVPERPFQDRNAKFGNCDWHLLAWFFRRICFISHRCGRSLLIVYDIPLVDAVVSDGKITTYGKQ